MHENYWIDLRTNRITFEDARFYRIDNMYFPSVTTILDCYPKGAQYFEWLKRMGQEADSIRDKAGERGSKVHSLTEDLDQGIEVNLLNGEGNPSCSMVEWSMFERYVDFAKRYKPQLHAIEQHVGSAKLGFAGTIDRVLTINEKKLIVDIKTSNSIYPHYWLQLAAYRELWAEQNQDVDGVAVLWLNAKTRTEGRSADAVQGKGWQMIQRFDTSQDWQLFQATQALWLAENKDIEPKLFSYQLSHKKI